MEYDKPLTRLLITGLDDVCSFLSFNINIVVIQQIAHRMQKYTPFCRGYLHCLDFEPYIIQTTNRYAESTRDIQTTAILLLMGNCFRDSMVLQDSSFIGKRFSDLITRMM